MTADDAVMPCSCADRKELFQWLPIQNVGGVTARDDGAVKPGIRRHSWSYAAIADSTDGCKPIHWRRQLMNNGAVPRNLAWPHRESGWCGLSEY